MKISKELKRVETLMGWGGLPRFALGVSEGGAMALLAATSIKFQVNWPPMLLAEQIQGLPSAVSS